jgi:hypothetical protein
MWFGSLWDGFVRRMWKSLEMYARETLDCYKQSLMGSSGGNSEDQTVNRNTDRKDCAPEVSDGHEDSTGNGLEAICVIW